MKKINKGIVAKFLFSAACAFVIFFTSGCNPKDEVTSLYDEGNVGQNPAPVIDSIGAVNGAYSQLAGVGILRVYGKNFSGNKDDNFVQFNDRKGTVLNSTSTTVDVQVPYLAKDTIVVKVSVFKAISYSNEKIISLKDPATVLLSDKFVNVRSLTFDANNVLYASLVDNQGVKLGIKKWDPVAGKFVSFVEPNYAPSYWPGMKFGPDGNLYVVGAQKRIGYVTPAGGAIATFVLMNDVTSLSDLDFDADKNIWTGGSVPSNKIYSANLTSKAVTGFPFTGTVQALRVFNGYLYLAAKRDSIVKIYRMKINSGTSLGNEETYFDISGNVAGSPDVTSITFSSDGYLYIGLSKAPGILFVAPNASGFEPYYNSVLQLSDAYGRYMAFAWDNGNYLYVGQDKVVDKTTTPVVIATQLTKINTIKTSAPYYGIK